jgi:hypothetical protein
MLQKFVNYNWADSYGFLAKLNQFLPKGLLPEMSVLRPGFVIHLTTNGHFSGRTAPLTYRCRIFLFIQQIYVLNILNMPHILLFFLFKMPFIS